MKRVCFFADDRQGTFGDYVLETFDPAPYFPGRTSLRGFVNGGLDTYVKRRALLSAVEVDRLYRERDPDYMRFVRDLVDRYADFDLLVMTAYTCIHPEILHRELARPIKVLGFIDDPMSTYARGIPYLWACDGAFHISPSYLDDLFPRALERWGCRSHFWWPLCPPSDGLPDVVDEAFFARRDESMVYVGKMYEHKVSRLVRLKRQFGSRFQIHGRWPMRGYSGLMQPLFGQPLLPQRVRSLSHDERRAIYLRTKIGFNMHLSETPAETGNARMYEAPAHGMMLLSDKAALDAHAQIFVPDREAVFYDTIEDAIEKAEYYLAHDQERIEIAWRGFERVRRDYDADRYLVTFLDWAAGLRDRRPNDLASSPRG